MGFCTSCGYKNEDGAAFCFQCGAAIPTTKTNTTTETVNSGDDFVSKRKSTLVFLDDFIKYMDTNSSIYQQYVKSIKTLKMLKKTPDDQTALLVFAILFSFGVVCTFSIIAEQWNKNHYFTGWSVLIAFILAIIAAVFWILFKRRFDKHTLDYNDGLKMFRSEEENLAKVFSDYCDTHDCPIGIEYIDPAVLRKIRDLVRSGRADTCKEAINIMLNDQRLTYAEMQRKAIISNTAASPIFVSIFWKF